MADFNYCWIKIEPKDLKTFTVQSVVSLLETTPYILLQNEDYMTKIATTLKKRNNFFSSFSMTIYSKFFIKFFESNNQAIVYCSSLLNMNVQQTLSLL